MRGVILATVAPAELISAIARNAAKALNLNDLRGTVHQLCTLAALLLAIAATLKLFGMVSLRPGVLEMCAASIALSLVK
jgi:hypothetical protein